MNELRSRVKSLRAERVTVRQALFPEMFPSTVKTSAVAAQTGQLPEGVPSHCEKYALPVESIPFTLNTCIIDDKHAKHKSPLLFTGCDIAKRDFQLQKFIQITSSNYSPFSKNHGP